MNSRPDHRSRQLPLALVGTVVLGIVVLLGSALGGPLRFGPPRWMPAALPTATPAPPPTQPVSTQTADPVQSSGSGPDLTWLVITLGALAVAAIVFFVVRAVLARRRDVAAPAALLDPDGLPAEVQEPSVETTAPYLRRGLRRALDELDRDRSPSNAIVAAWLGLQEAAEDAGYRRLEAETPTEFTARILRLTGVDGAALATLRRLYLAVRFGDRVATANDVDDARAALRLLEQQWAIVASPEGTLE